MEYLIIYAFFCLLIGWMASSTTLGFGSGFLLSILLTPVVGFIIVLFYPSKEHRERQNQLLKQALQNQNHPQTSAADEIEKLKSLLDKGALTQAEYDTQKARLLQ